MPRTKLDRFSNNPDTYRRMVNRTIREAMARQEMSEQKVLAASIGLSPTQVSNRFKKGWSSYELFLVNRVLHFTDSEKIKLMGGTT